MKAKSDSSLFVRITSSSITYLLAYVDDILVTGSNFDEISQLIHSLYQQFALKDMGTLHYFLGIQVDQPTPHSYVLRQTKYIDDLLTRASMHDAKPQMTPMAVGLKLSQSGTEVFDNPTLYRSTVGALQYLCITRPDLSFAVNKVSQYMHSPLVEHWQAVKQILRYIQGTRDLGLTLQKCSSFRLSVMIDADWASDVTDRRSTSGFCIFLGSNLISWASKKQSIVSRSSTEAEYRALALAVAELTWVQALIAELHLPLPREPPLVFCDNMSTVLLSANPVLHARTKHIELDLYFIREKVQRRQISMSHVSSVDQLADILTKPLPRAPFLSLRDKLHSPLSFRGGGGGN